MSKTHTYEYIFNYFKNNMCDLLEDKYINSSTKMNYRCSCGNITSISFDNFRSGKRCKECGIKKFSNKQRISQTEVDLLFSSKGWKNNSVYENSKQILNVMCNKGHETTSTVSNFKQGFRCLICKIEKYSGSNSNLYNPNREEISLNQRLRKKFSNFWIKKNMKSDKYYKNYMVNPKLYHLDHIIPISIFSKLLLEFNLDETKLKKIINQRDNLQILTSNENIIKKDKGSIFEAAQYLMLYEIKLI